MYISDGNGDFEIGCFTSQGWAAVVTLWSIFSTVVYPTFVSRHQLKMYRYLILLQCVFWKCAYAMIIIPSLIFLRKFVTPCSHTNGFCNQTLTKQDICMWHPRSLNELIFTIYQWMKMTTCTSLTTMVLHCTAVGQPRGKSDSKVAGFKLLI